MLFPGHGEITDPALEAMSFCSEFRRVLTFESELFELTDHASQLRQVGGEFGVPGHDDGGDPQRCPPESLGPTDCR